MTRSRLALGSAAACLVLAACSLPPVEIPSQAAADGQAPSEQPVAIPKSEAMSAEDAKRLQTQVMDFADDMSVRLSEAMEKIEQTSSSIEARVAAHQLKYTVAHGATSIAASINPRVAMADMLVMISLQRVLVERNIVPVYFGEQGEPLVRMFEASEREIRALAASALTPEQIAAIDQLIARWVEENPDRKFAAHVRFSDFAYARQAAVEARNGRPSNILGFLFIDPLSGLDPTTREIEQTRLFAERAFFYLQRMPLLISWQAELLFIDTVTEPESRAVLAAIESVKRSVADITAQVESIRAEVPGLVSAEREAAFAQAGEIIETQRVAAIEQALAGLRAEREALIEQIAAEEERLSPMLTELREASDSITVLSESARETTAAFAALAKQLRIGEPKGAEHHPFNITEYSEALREASVAATELTQLTESISGATDPDALNARLDLVEQRLAAAESAVDRLIDKAFRLGAILIVLFSLGMAGVVVLAAVLRRKG